MTTNPLTKSDIHDWDKPKDAPYGFFMENDILSHNKLWSFL